MTITKEEIKAMSVKEREELLATFWDVMEEEPYVDMAEEESEEELNLLQDRLNEYNRDPSNAITWEDFLLHIKVSVYR